MSEKNGQENFENILFGEEGKVAGGGNEANRKEDANDKPKPEPERETITCPYCEDVGVCSFCKRGKEAASKLPPTNIFKKLRNFKKR